MSSVFRGVLDKPLLRHFAEFCREDATKEEKILAYAAMVSEVYKSSVSYTELVCRLVFEDENVYVRSRAQARAVDKNTAEAARRELSAFGELASLTPEDFRQELGVAYVSPFSSRNVDLPRLYQRRMKNYEEEEKYIRSIGKQAFG